MTTINDLSNAITTNLEAKTMTTTTTTEADLTTLMESIRVEYKLYEGAVRASLIHARNVGGFLAQVKGQIKDKGFVNWVQTECPFSYSCADNYIQVAAHWDKFDPDALAEFTMAEFLAAIRKAPNKKGRKPSQPAADVSHESKADQERPAETVAPAEIAAVHEGPLATPAEIAAVHQQSLATPAELTGVYERSLAPIGLTQPLRLRPFQDTARAPAGLSREYVCEVAAEVGIEPEKLLKALELLDVAVEPADPVATG